MGERQQESAGTRAGTIPVQSTSLGALGAAGAPGSWWRARSHGRRAPSRAASRCCGRTASGTRRPRASGRRCGSEAVPAVFTPRLRRPGRRPAARHSHCGSRSTVTPGAGTCRAHRVRRGAMVAEALGAGDQDKPLRARRFRRPDLVAWLRRFLYDLGTLALGRWRREVDRVNFLGTISRLRVIDAGSRTHRDAPASCSTTSRSSSTARSIRASGRTAFTPHRPTRRCRSTS